MKFLNSTKKPSKKNTELSQKKFLVGQTHLKFDGCHDNVKYDEHASDI